MAKTMQVEVWVCVGSAEEYVAHEDVETCAERANDELNSDSRRMVKVVLTVPVPEPLVMTGTVPAEPTTGTLAATSVEN